MKIQTEDLEGIVNAVSKFGAKEVMIHVDDLSNVISAIDTWHNKSNSCVDVFPYRKSDRISIQYLGVTVHFVKW